MFPTPLCDADSWRIDPHKSLVARSFPNERRVSNPTCPTGFRENIAPHTAVLSGFSAGLMVVLRTRRSVLRSAPYTQAPATVALSRAVIGMRELSKNQANNSINKDQ